MDRAHLVSFRELHTFGDAGVAFSKDEANFAALCQRCHAAFDMWCGVMPPYRVGHKTRYFDYDRLLPLLRRRSKLLQVLISLTAEDPRPDAPKTIEGGSIPNNHLHQQTSHGPIVRTPTEAVTPTPGPADHTTPFEQTAAGGHATGPSKEMQVSRSARNAPDTQIAYGI